MRKKDRFVCGLLCACALVCVPQAHANLRDRKAVTWNLQGASHATVSKWSTSISRLMNQGRVEVLALQEAGTPPDSARLTSALAAQPTLPGQPALISPASTPLVVQEYRWSFGSTSRPIVCWIYYVAVASRVNLAIVTRERPQAVIIMPPHLTQYPAARPVLGVRFAGGDHYFTLHASASGGGDSGPLVAAVHNYFASRQDASSQWMIMGDFNRAPLPNGHASARNNNLQTWLQNNVPQVYQNLTVVTQASPTQSSGGILDYAVVGQYRRPPAQTPPFPVALYNATLAGMLSSDHDPVVFGKLN